MQKGLQYSESVFRELKLLELIIDGLSEGVAVGHRDGGLVLFNSAAREMGFSVTKEPREKWSQHYGIFYPDGKTLVPKEDLPMCHALAGKTISDFEMVIRNQKGTRIISADAHPIPPEMGVVVFKDITAERMKSQALESAKEAAEQASRMKTEFLTNMSHEIRTPLGAVLGFSELLADSRQFTGETALWVSSIRRNAEHLSTLVDGVLDLSKIEAGMLALAPEWTTLARCLDEILESQASVARSKGLELTIHREPGLPEMLYVDDVAIRRILLNIIGNALKFTNAGEIQVRILRGVGGLVEIRVEDPGIGISPEAHDKLFKPFSQADGSLSRRYGGTGLGLIVSQRLAQMMGGDVRLLRSAPGRGSLFSITFRAIPEVRSGISRRPPVERRLAGNSQDLPTYLKSKPLAGRRILVVEDNEDMQLLLRKLLTSAGAKVFQAGDGAVGVQTAARETLDLIVMDVQMPNLDGYQATQRLRASGFGKPIVALTAHALVEERIKCLDAGCNDYLSKPVNPGQLVSTLAALTADIDVENSVSAMHGNSA